MKKLETTMMVMMMEGEMQNGGLQKKKKNKLKSFFFIVFVLLYSKFVGWSFGCIHEIVSCVTTMKKFHFAKIEASHTQRLKKNVINPDELCQATRIMMIGSH